LVLIKLAWLEIGSKLW